MDGMGLDPVAWISRQLCRLSQPKDAFSSAGGRSGGGGGMWHSHEITWKRYVFPKGLKSFILHLPNTGNKTTACASFSCWYQLWVGMHMQSQSLNHCKWQRFHKKNLVSRFASQTTSDTDKWILFPKHLPLQSFLLLKQHLRQKHWRWTKHQKQLLQPSNPTFCQQSRSQQTAEIAPSQPQTHGRKL